MCVKINRYINIDRAGLWINWVIHNSSSIHLIHETSLMSQLSNWVSSYIYVDSVHCQS